MRSFVLEPGSPEAIDQGCTCPEQEGPGAVVTPDGLAAYLCDAQHPLHGLDIAETWPVGAPANDNG